MDDALTAHGAATLGALGAVLLLAGRSRLHLLVGFGALGLAQAGLFVSQTSLTFADVGAATLAAGLAGMVVLAALAALLFLRPALALPLR